MILESLNTLITKYMLAEDKSSQLGDFYDFSKLEEIIE